MADEKITLNLSMASVPANPAQATYGTKASRRKFGFNFGKFIQQACVMALILALSIGCYFVISGFFVQSVQVVGVSMVPTLTENNHYLLNRWAFRNREPKAGDIVVIRDPEDHGISVKRIVATSGQSILFHYGKVFIDGKEIKEPYLMPDTPTYTYAKATEEMFTCGKGQFFVLGDNRPRSVDSRVYGPVSRQDILGLVVIR